jgi:hypothetical protein
MYEQHQKNNLKYVLDIVGVKESDYISVVLSADQQEYVLTLTNGAEFKIPSGLPEHDN